METLRDFVAELLESQGAAIATLEPDGLEVLAPPVLRNAMGWPELARLGFGAELPDQAMRIGLEGDWLDRFGGLLGENGRWAERQMTSANPPALGDAQRLLDHAIELPNAVCRFHSVEATWTRCLILTFRYTALSDEKREGLAWLGFNLGTGAVLDEVLTRLRAALADDDDWCLPEPEARRAAGSTWDSALLASRLQPLLDDRLRRELEPFLRAMHRRLDRDRARVHAYHDDLRSGSLKRLAALAGRDGEKAEADRRRESLRVATIEREYRAKLDDLRHNYALRVSAEWVQALDIVRAGAAPGRGDPETKRRKTDPVRLAPGRPAGRGAALRLGSGSRSGSSGLRRETALDRARRAGAVRCLRKSVVPCLSSCILPSVWSIDGARRGERTGLKLAPRDDALRLPAVPPVAAGTASAPMMSGTTGCDPPDWPASGRSIPGASISQSAALRSLLRNFWLKRREPVAAVGCRGGGRQGRLPGPIGSLVLPWFKEPRVHHLDGVDNQVNNVILRHPVHHTGEESAAVDPDAERNWPSLLPAVSQRQRITSTWNSGSREGYLFACGSAAFALDLGSNAEDVRNVYALLIPT